MIRLRFEFKFEKAKIEYSNRSLMFATGTTPKLLIDEANEIGQNWTKFFIPYCLLPWRFVNN